MPTLSFLNSTNFNILIVGIAVGSIALLGFTVYFNNRESVTNRAFLYYCLAVVLWGISNFFEYQFKTTIAALWALRIHLFISVWYSLAFFHLAHVFLNKQIAFPKWYKYFIVPLAAITSVVTLTPLIFEKLTGVAKAGQVTTAVIGPGMALFGFTAFGLLLAGLVILFRRAIQAKGIEKRQLWLIFVGMFLTACLTLIFNLILPVIFENVKYIPFAALFVLPFIGLISYTIYRHKLFNIKVVSVAFVAFILTIFSLFNVIYATGSSQIMLNASFFILILIGSIILIRSILREVEQRERLEIITEKLETANTSLENLVKQRESLVHLVTHKVKGSFTRSKYIFAGILDGTFGEINPEIKKRAQQGLDSDDTGIKTVDLVLNAANLQKGAVKYDMKVIDFKEIVLNLINEKKAEVESRGLQIESNMEDGTYKVLGDVFWLKEAVNNLIENSIKYTKAGKITIKLADGNGKVKLSVKDTGIGITDEDKKNLFTEGGRGKDSVKTNVDSTGYGLYSVKLIVEAHKGKVWGESEGQDKGSTFYLEMDAAA
jgi:signal transduction histidine kinase